MQNILYSFRRCPYAMRARLALSIAGQQVELREIKLKEKPLAFLDVSASATVPCLHWTGGVLDESLDIMIWALERDDPENWLEMPQEGHEWIARADGPFKQALDRTKYANRYLGVDPVTQRDQACAFLTDLNDQLDKWIFDAPSLADYAILPFVRQFAFIDKPWFDAQPWPQLHGWLSRFLDAEIFEGIMEKYPVWQPGTEGICFPPPDVGSAPQANGSSG